MNRRPTILNPTVRRSIEEEIERLIALLDAFDGDADTEEGDLDLSGFIW